MSDVLSSMCASLHPPSLGGLSLASLHPFGTPQKDARSAGGYAPRERNMAFVGLSAPFRVSRRRAQAAFGVEVAQLALEDFTARLARQRVEELDVLRHLEIGEPRAQEIPHRCSGKLRTRLRLDAGKQ